MAHYDGHTYFRMPILKFLQEVLNRLNIYPVKWGPFLGSFKS